MGFVVSEKTKAELKKQIQHEVEMEQMYHCCRWCHHYVIDSGASCGGCTHPKVCNSIDSMSGGASSLAVYDVSESGYSIEVIREVLGSVDIEKVFADLFYMLREWGTGTKKMDMFKTTFHQIWEQFTDMTLSQDLDDKVLKCFVDHLCNPRYNTDVEKVEIPEPRDFVCKYFE